MITFTFDSTHFETNIIPYEKIKPLLDMINLTRQDDALEYLHDFIEDLKQYDYSNLMASVVILSTSIFNALSNTDGSKNKLELSYATFTNEISRLETLTEMEKSFAYIITYICENKQLARNNKTDNTISNIIMYIESNFTDVNISSKTIADVVKLSPRYVSKLFYEHTEQTIQSYINEYRINMAKDMLKTSEYTIEEILSKIGWPNLKHFYTVFKKYTGLTPSEYRKSSPN